MIRVAKGPRLGFLLTLVGVSLAQVACALAIAFCVQLVFDRVLAPEVGVVAVGSHVQVAALFVVSLAAIGALEVLRSGLAEKLGFGYVAELRAALFERVMQTSQNTRGQREGALLLPFVGDLTAIKKWVSDGVVKLISASITVAMLGVVLALQSPVLAFAAGGVLLTAALCIVAVGGPLSRAIVDTRGKRGAVANFVSASFKAATTVQAFDRLERESERLRRRAKALERAGVRLGVLAGLTTAIVACASGALVAVTLIVGMQGVGAGLMSVGLVAAAMSIVGLLSGALRDLGVGYELWRRAEASFRKVAEFLTLQPSVSSSEAIRRFHARDGKFSLRRVEVKGLLRRVSVEAQGGDVVNVTGLSGSGKSTLLAIAARLREPDAGKVRLDGNDLSRVSITSLRRRIGVASAATPLMRGTIAMNLRYRAPKATQEEVDEIIRICVLQPVIDRFRAKEKTKLSEGAPELSRGEVQRLQIARAMLGAPTLLVLDEVDTHLGGAIAQSIAKALASYGGIVLMTAASPEFRDVATTTWRIADGRIEGSVGSLPAHGTAEDAA